MLQAQWRALPQLIRFMATQFADGVALGWACGLALIRLDVGSIGSLLERSGSAAMTALFFVQGGLLFGTLAMSVALMNLGEID